jgi:hypothetical protein
MYQTERRTPRYAFAAPVEIIDRGNARVLVASTGNLSCYGCFVETAAPFVRGTRIKVTITYNGSLFMAYGRVAYATAEGMGIVFSGVEPDDAATLERWLEQCAIAT